MAPKFREVFIPDPLDYLEDADMYLSDASSRLQETEDLDYAAWQSFYYSTLKSNGLWPKKNRVPTDESLAKSRSREHDDPNLILHSFLFLSDSLSRSHGDLRPFAIPPIFLKNLIRERPQVGQCSPLHQPLDRVCILTKGPQVYNPFCLNNVAKAMLSVDSHNNYGKDLTLVDASHAILCELAMKFTQTRLAAVDPKRIPEKILSYSARGSQTFLSECVNHQVEELILQLDIHANSPFLSETAFLTCTVKALAISVRLTLDVSTSRVLLRIANLRQKQGNIAEAILLLDEIEEKLCSNGAFLDQGLFHLTRAECMLSLLKNVSEKSDVYIQVLCDAMKSLQFSIAAFDKAHCVELLKKSVLIAAAIAYKLDQQGMCNFYSVKNHQASTSNASNSRFFPADGTGLGQPKLPVDLLQSSRASKPDKTYQSPISPIGKGRGIQTLISWNISSCN